LCPLNYFQENSRPPITWYDAEGVTQDLPALDDFVWGENEYALPQLDLKPTTWDVCDAYFQEKKANNQWSDIDKEHKYWIWILPMKVEGGQGKLVAVSSSEGLRIPFPINRGM
jgi:hypothetical protein